MGTEEKECEQVSRQVPEEQCENVTERKCTQVQECTQEKQCKTEEVCKNEVEKQCTNTKVCEKEQQCTTETKIVPETTYVNECKNVVSTNCVDVAQVVSSPVATVASYAATPIATSPLALTSFPSSAALGASPLALGSSPYAATLGASPLLSQLYRGKRDAEADADADPQFFINGPFGSSVATSAVVKTAPVCTPVTRSVCQKVPKTTQRTIAAPKCVSA